MMKQEAELVSMRQRLKNSKPNYWIAPSVKGLTARFTDEEVLYAANEIIEAVCKYFNITIRDLKSQKRDRVLVDPRHICMYIIRMKTPMQLDRIGKLFDRDHTTIMHAVRSVKDQLTHPVDTRFKDIVRALNSLI